MLYRRIAEAPLSPKGGVSDAQAEVLESIIRQASKKKAQELSEATQREYVQAEAKARYQEEAVRKIHQKEANKAMDVSHLSLSLSLSLSRTHTHTHHTHCI